MTLHEYLSICNNHGQMVKAKNQALCSRASPAECNVCFPDISPAQFMRRELFLKSFFAECDAFVSPSQFLLERFATWGLPPEKLHMFENGLDGGQPAPPRPAPRDGRRNRYRLDTTLPLRHPLEKHRSIGDVLALVLGKGR